jgi:serine/threonine protein kinase
MRISSFKRALSSLALSPEERDALTRAFLDEEAVISRLTRSRLSSARFERLQLLGRGGFAEVWLVRDRITSDLRALKVLSKATVISLEQIANVRTERDILVSANSPWVTKLHASFHDAQNFFFLLEYMPGGDLRSAFEKRVFSESMARFFAGEIALALRSIHALNVCHRDLKPENVLIGKDGHIKLSDFGLSGYCSKADTGIEGILGEIQSLLHPPCEQPPVAGTLQYIAPEVLRREAPTFASDYWSLGVLLYEMLFGVTPFAGKSTGETRLRIVHWQKSLRFPGSGRVSAEAVDLLRHLLCDVNGRYGFEEVAGHPFFRGFDFANPRANVAPMVPVLRHSGTTAHIAPVPVEVGWEPQADGELADLLFLGFTYTKPRKNRTLAGLVSV